MATINPEAKGLYLTAILHSTDYEQIITENTVRTEITLKSESEWLSIIEQFEDANFYQTRTFGKHSLGGSELEHFIVKHNGKIIGAAEVRILTVKFLNRGIAYIRWGPLWKLKNQENDFAKLLLILKKLRNEYVVKRKLKLRIFPECYKTDDNFLIDIYRKAGFRLNKKNSREKTILLDIRPELNTIRSNFKRKWRVNLKKAEENNIEIVEGYGNELFERFFNIYKEMQKLKNFKENIDVKSFAEMQHELPDKYKMRVFLAQKDGKPAAALVGTAIGKTGICLLAASNQLGREVRASFKLHLQMIKWLKDMGCEYYDVGGIDKEKNPGGYRFKSGLNGKEVTFIGTFDSCICPVSWLITKFGELLIKLKSMF